MTLELKAEIRKLYLLEAARSKKLDPMAIAKAKATLQMFTATLHLCYDSKDVV